MKNLEQNILFVFGKGTMAYYTNSFNLFSKHSAPFVFNANELLPSISLHIRADLRLPAAVQVCRTGTDRGHSESNGR